MHSYIYCCVLQAVQRLMERNKLSEDIAVKRVQAQLSNQERVSQADVVLSTLWAPDVTQQQVQLPDTNLSGPRRLSYEY